MLSIPRFSKHGLNAAAFSLGKTDPLTGPFKATIELTCKCNARCKFCQRWKSDGTDLTTNEWKSILSDLRNNGVMNVSLSGGEPLLRKDIFELIDYCKEIGLSTTLNTNGFIVHKYIDEIANSSLSSIYFSLDSHSGIIHDSLRGVKGIFDSAVENIKQLSGNGRVKVYVNSVVTHENYRDVGKIVEMVAKIGANGVGFTPVHDFREGNFAVEGELKNIDWDLFEEQIMTMEPRMSIYPLSYYMCFKVLWTNPEELYENTRCVAGYMQIHTGHDGSVYPCQSMFAKMGNLKDESFSSIWNSRNAHAIRNDIKNGRHPKCWAGCIGGPNLMLNKFYSMISNRQYLNYLIQSKFGRN